MDLEITCDCGWSCRGSEGDVALATIEHGKAVHQVELTREQALAAARPVPAADAADT